MGASIGANVTGWQWQPSQVSVTAAAADTFAETATQVAGGLGGAVEITVGVESTR